nr:FMN-binding negative transcriptional regulator [uncultured Tolumonas sp.]
MSFSQLSLTEQAQVKTILTTYPLATLVVSAAGSQQAVHIPLLWQEKPDGNLVLQGHLARHNPLFTQRAQQALVLFQGPSHYITPNYYPSKAVDGRAVPTWNYVAVHLQGSLHFIEDAAWCLNVMSRLSHQMEATQPDPWAVADAPPDYVNRQLKAVVGLEIAIDQCSLKVKASQNQSASNQQGVITGLQSENTPHACAMANWIATAGGNA